MEWQPELANTRNRLTQEIATCDAGIKRMRDLSASFEQTEPKRLLEGRIQQLIRRKGTLAAQLVRINEVTELAIAQREFGSMEQGGLTSREAEQLLTASQVALANGKDSLRELDSFAGNPPVAATNSREMPHTQEIQALVANLPPGDVLNVRSAPQTTAPIVSLLHLSDSVQLGNGWPKRDDDGTVWVEVITRSGRGWVNRYYLEILTGC